MRRCAVALKTLHLDERRFRRDRHPAALSMRLGYGIEHP